MRPSLQTVPASPPRPLSEVEVAPGSQEICRMCPAHNSPSAHVPSSLSSAGGPVCDWLESQANVLGLWLDRLIADGDPGDLISLVHRQQAWLQMLRAHMGRG